MPIVTISPAGRLTAQDVTVTGFLTTNQLAVTNSVALASVQATGQVVAQSFRLDAEAETLPSRLDYTRLVTRVAAVEARPSGTLSALPRFNDDSMAKVNGIPRFGLYRFGNGANDFRMRVSSDVP